MRAFSVIACLLAGLAAGCTSIQLLALPNESESDGFDFNISDGKPASVAQVPPEIRQEMIRMELKEFGKPGAWVRVCTESGPMSPSTMGTIHRITKDELVLWNCITRAAIPDPEGQLQCQTTHTPVMSFAIQELTHFTCLTEAPSKDLTPQSTDELSAVIGVIYRDGSQQVWGKERSSDDGLTSSQAPQSQDQ